MDLTETEIRVLGCLLEKQRTTPDAYPLSVNALRLACNQSTNRDPVVAYDEETVRDALRRAERQGWVRLASGAGSRAAKFRHRLDERLPMDGAEQAIMGLLMLRGPQTPGECKTRGERLHAFADLEGVSATLDRLVDRGLVARLARRPGQKEERYAHVLAGAPDAMPQAREQPHAAASGGAEVGERGPDLEGAAVPTPEPSPGADVLRDVLDRLTRLEREVIQLRAALSRAS